MAEFYERRDFITGGCYLSHPTTVEAKEVFVFHVLVTAAVDII